MKRAILCGLVLQIFLIHISFAEATKLSVQPGVYVLPAESGTLTITRSSTNELRFSIDTVGSNCHICGVHGTINGKNGLADSGAVDGSDSNCDILFVQTNTQIKVSPQNSGACRAYCGARAGFDGTYSLPPKSCEASAVRQTRERFLKRYQLKQYHQAIQILKPLLAQCAQFMHRITRDEIRNDLALAQLHHREPRACLNTLASTFADGYENEATLQATMPPCDFDNYIPTAQRIWYNKALCSKAADTK